MSSPAPSVPLAAPDMFRSPPAPRIVGAIHALSMRHAAGGNHNKLILGGENAECGGPARKLFAMRQAIEQVGAESTPSRRSNAKTISPPPATTTIDRKMLLAFVPYVLAFGVPPLAGALHMKGCRRFGHERSSVGRMF